jgi:6-phosphogluconolactonase/glucosamine-6-phosphate isomerase/deaminase
VLFVVSGAAKAEALARVLRADAAAAGEDLPARFVAQRARHVHWVVDRAAAG